MESGAPQRCKRFTHAGWYRDRSAIENFASQQFDLIVTARSASHDKAREFRCWISKSTRCTVNLPGGDSQHCPEAVFVFLSTNKYTAMRQRNSLNGTGDTLRLRAAGRS